MKLTQYKSDNLCYTNPYQTKANPKLTQCKFDQKQRIKRRNFWEAMSSIKNPRSSAEKKQGAGRFREQERGRREEWRDEQRMALQEKHRGEMMKQENPMTLMKPENPRIVMKEENPKIVIKEEDPKIVMKEEHPKIVQVEGGHLAGGHLQVQGGQVQREVLRKLIYEAVDDLPSCQRLDLPEAEILWFSMHRKPPPRPLIPATALCNRGGQIV